MSAWCQSIVETDVQHDMASLGQELIDLQIYFSISVLVQRVTTYMNGYPQYSAHQGQYTKAAYFSLIFTSPTTTPSNLPK